MDWKFEQAKMNSEKLAKALHAFCGEQSCLSMATIDEAGKPHNANLYFTTDRELNFYFVSADKSAHSQHVKDRPEVAVTIFKPMPMWQQLQGVQLHGHCEKLSSRHRAQAWELYVAKFPFVVEVENTVRAQDFYRIRPHWIRWIDNSVRFGFKVEATWPMNQSMSVSP